jgi:hypothetical protein
MWGSEVDDAKTHACSRCDEPGFKGKVKRDGLVEGRAGTESPEV